MPDRLRPLSAILLVIALSGCLRGEADPPGQPAVPAYPACEHPWPCGDGSEWPLGLSGPFQHSEPLAVRVPGDGSTELAGHIYLPELPEGVRAPVVLWSSPYFGQVDHYADSEDIRQSVVVPVDLLVEDGYAVALFSVRGTGFSGGCFEQGGPREQRDQALLVEWLAGQPWSNGRVAMMGLSYHGTTPWMAAIQDPPALKTIVAAGMVADRYTFHHTPQGLQFTETPRWQSLWTVNNAVLPPLVQDPSAERVQRYLPVAADRACPEVVQTVGEVLVERASPDRNAAYWEARDYERGFGDVTAAVFLVHGFQDLWGSGHQLQEAEAWGLLDVAPKHMLEGQWGHRMPGEEDVPGWSGRLLSWLGFWLKGFGDPPAVLGTVEYQDGAGAWHDSPAWPPAEAVHEALYLTDDDLSAAPEAGAVAFRPVPHRQEGDQQAQVENLVCPPEGPEPVARVFETEPLPGPVLLAGNPFALLRLSSDQPLGQVALHLYDLSPDFTCEGGIAHGARALSTGGADLRFHAGNYVAQPFPVGEPAAVRIDLTNLAEVVGQGHRLAVVASYGAHGYRSSASTPPMLQLHGGAAEEASHLVLPVVDGSLGGGPPSGTYPPRPFLPP